MPISRRKLLVGAGAVLAGGVASAVELRRMGSIGAYSERVAATRAPLSDPVDLRELVRFGTLAASGHNTQPWRFRLEPMRIVVVPDLARRTPAVDPDDHHLFVSLGAAVENLAIAARARGFHAAATLDADHRLTLELAQASREDSPLLGAIPLRQSTRADFDGRPVSAADMRLLEDAAAVPGVDLAVLSDKPALERVLELVLAGNAAQMADPAFMRELKAWIRFNPRAAMQTGDGLFSAATGNPSVPSWLGNGLFERLFRLDGENAKYTKQVRSSAGVAVFLGDRADPTRWIDVGRSCQRFALQATALGLRCSFINQPVEVAALRPALAGLVGAPTRRPDLVMRFGHGPTLPYSLRRPVQAVIDRA